MESKGRLLRATIAVLLTGVVFTTLPSLGAETPYGVLFRIAHDEVTLEIGRKGFRANVLYLTLFQHSTYRYFYLLWDLDEEWEKEELVVIVQKLRDYLESPRVLFLIYPDPEGYEPWAATILGTGESVLIRLTEDVHGEPSCYAEIELSHDEAKKLLEVLLDVLR